MQKLWLRASRNLRDELRRSRVCVHNGKVWEKASLHLKSAIPDFDRHNVAKVVALDLLKKQVL